MLKKLKLNPILIVLPAVLLNFCLASFAKDLTLNVLCWEGYTQPYTQAFTRQIKEKYNLDVQFNIQNVSSPQGFWDSTRQKQADLISPAHNLFKSTKWGYIRGRIILPLNLENIPNYQNLRPFLKQNTFVFQDGNTYGVPFAMGPYGLAYNADKVKEPDSWDVLWTAEAKGRYTLSQDYPECNIYITALAHGASYLEIYDADRLSRFIPLKTLQATLAHLGKNAYSFWKGTASPEEFPRLFYAATWGYAVAQANKKGGNWKMASPKEGVTLWVDHWAITYAVKEDSLKKKICEEWINYCLGNAVQTGMVRNWGVTPVVETVTGLTEKEKKAFRIGDDGYWKHLFLWKNLEPRTRNIYDLIWRRAMKTQI